MRGFEITKTYLESCASYPLKVCRKYRFCRPFIGSRSDTNLEISDFGPDWIATDPIHPTTGQRGFYLHQGGFWLCQGELWLCQSGFCLCQDGFWLLQGILLNIFAGYACRVGPGIAREVSAFARAVFGFARVLLASPGRFSKHFLLAALTKIQFSKKRQSQSFGLEKIHILAKFHHPSPKIKTTFVEKTANCGDPLTGTERCNEKGNLLASLGG